MSTLHIATVATETVWKDPSQNIQNTETHITKVLELFPHTQVVLFPEINLMGYVLDESNQDLAEPLDGTTITAIKRIAKQYNVAIIASIIQNNLNGQPYNTAVVIDNHGQVIASYNKNHLFTESAEPEFYTTGTELSTFELGDWKCGLSICFDIRYPRLFEAYRKAGVECIFAPFNWIAGRNKPGIFETMVKARAHENQYYMVAVDRSGSDPNNEYYGVSMIANPYAEDISERNGIYSAGVLDKTDIQMLREALPLEGGFKKNYIID